MNTALAKPEEAIPCNNAQTMQRMLSAVTGIWHDVKLRNIESM